MLEHKQRTLRECLFLWNSKYFGRLGRTSCQVFKAIVGHVGSTIFSNFVTVYPQFMILHENMWQSFFKYYFQCHKNSQIWFLTFQALIKYGYEGYLKYFKSDIPPSNLEKSPNSPLMMDLSNKNSSNGCNGYLEINILASSVSLLLYLIL